MQPIAHNPPIMPAKKFVKTCNAMFETKCPIKLEGMVINVYLDVNLIKLKLKFCTVFLIFLKFKNVINVMDKKKDIIIEFMPTIGVKIIKLKSSTTEPKT